jgi:chorismate mutase
MNRQLLLDNVRTVLSRLEETIIFALIERAQFHINRTIYDTDAFGEETEGESLCGYMLRETEKLHAQMRRYTSPDENPFFEDLPEPILPQLHFWENPLAPNTVNLNAKLRSTYENAIVPHICQEGDDKQYGSGAVCDVACLQGLSKRIHYGKFVAESKYRGNPNRYRPPIEAQDRDAILDLITDEEVEDGVIERVGLKARTYAREVLPDNGGTTRVKPESIIAIYTQWVIPLNKQVQVEYMLQRTAEH